MGNQVEWVEADGLSVRALIDPTWRAGTTLVHIALELRNTASEPLAVPLLDTIGIQWQAAGGAWQSADAGRDGTSPGQPWTVLAPSSATRADRSANISASPDGTLDAIGRDGFGGEWAIRRLPPGPILIRLTLRSTAAPGAPPGVRVWTGELTTPESTVELTLPSSGA